MSCTHYQIQLNSCSMSSCWSVLDAWTPQLKELVCNCSMSESLQAKELVTVQHGRHINTHHPMLAWSILDLQVSKKLCTLLSDYSISYVSLGSWHAFGQVYASRTKKCPKTSKTTREEATRIAVWSSSEFASSLGALRCPGPRANVMIM